MTEYERDIITQFIDAQGAAELEALFLDTIIEMDGSMFHESHADDMYQIMYGIELLALIIEYMRELHSTESLASCARAYHIEQLRQLTEV